MQPDGVNLWYFKFRLFNLTEQLIILKIKSAKIKGFKSYGWSKLFIFTTDFLTQCPSNFVCDWKCIFKVGYDEADVGATFVSYTSERFVSVDEK